MDGSLLLDCQICQRFSEVDRNMEGRITPAEYELPGWLLVTLSTPQLSEVTGVPMLTLTLQLPELVVTVLFGGQVIVGFTLSVTVIFWLHVAELPAASNTVHFTTVTPLE